MFLVSSYHAGFPWREHRMNRIAAGPAHLFILSFIAKVHRRGTQAFFYYFLQGHNPLSRFIVNLCFLQTLQLLQYFRKLNLVPQEKILNVTLSLRLITPAGFVLEKVTLPHRLFEVWKTIHGIHDLIEELVN